MNFSHKSSLIIGLLIVLISVIRVSNACFITNCPPGGKRSLPMDKDQIQECQSCGPQGLEGRCYGTSICCSPIFGCLIGTPETRICQLEIRSTKLCQNPGNPCSRSGEMNLNGQCASDGICCTSETCTKDDSCHPKSLQNNLLNGESHFRKFSRQMEQQQKQQDSSDSSEPNSKPKPTLIRFPFVPMTMPIPSNSYNDY